MTAILLGFGFAFTLLIANATASAAQSFLPQETISRLQAGRIVQDLFACDKTLQEGTCRFLSSLPEEVRRQPLPKLDIRNAKLVLLTFKQLVMRIEREDDGGFIVNGRKIRLTAQTTPEDLYQTILGTFSRKKASWLRSMIPDAEASNLGDLQAASMAITAEVLMIDAHALQTCEEARLFAELCVNIGEVAARSPYSPADKDAIQNNTEKLTRITKTAADLRAPALFKKLCPLKSEQPQVENELKKCDRVIAILKKYRTSNSDNLDTRLFALRRALEGTEADSQQAPVSEPPPSSGKLRKAD